MFGDKPSDGNIGDDFFQQSEESSQFRQEYEMRKMKQACNILNQYSTFDFWNVNKWGSWFHKDTALSTCRYLHIWFNDICTGPRTWCYFRGIGYTEKFGTWYEWGWLFFIEFSSWSSQTKAHIDNLFGMFRNWIGKFH